MYKLVLGGNKRNSSFGKRNWDSEREVSVCTFFLRFIYEFLAVLGLRCCTSAFHSCSKWGLHFVATHWLLTEVLLLLQGTGSRAQA